MLYRRNIADFRFSPAVARRQRGFTIVDIVLTTLILGIMAAVAAPKIADSMVLSRVRAAALCVASDLEHARQRAKVKGSTQNVLFSPSTNTYSLYGLNDLDHSSKAYSVNLAAEPYKVSLASASFGATGTSLSVSFNRYGRPNYGGSLVVSLGGKQRTIVVDSVSGRVSIQP